MRNRYPELRTLSDSLVASTFSDETMKYHTKTIKQKSGASFPLRDNADSRECNIGYQRLVNLRPLGSEPKHCGAKRFGRHFL